MTTADSHPIDLTLQRDYFVRTASGWEQVYFLPMNQTNAYTALGLVVVATPAGFAHYKPGELYCRPAAKGEA